MVRGVRRVITPTVSPEMNHFSLTGRVVSPLPSGAEDPRPTDTAKSNGQEVEMALASLRYIADGGTGVYIRLYFSPSCNSFQI